MQGKPTLIFGWKKPFDFFPKYLCFAIPFLCPRDAEEGKSFLCPCKTQFHEKMASIQLNNFEPVAYVGLL